VITPLYGLRRQKKKYGQATACIGGGQGICHEIKFFRHGFTGQLQGRWSMIVAAKERFTSIGYDYKGRISPGLARISKTYSDRWLI
jgi:hypothetical protein